MCNYQTFATKPCSLYCATIRDVVWIETKALFFGYGHQIVHVWTLLPHGPYCIAASSTFSAVDQVLAQMSLLNYLRKKAAEELELDGEEFVGDAVGEGIRCWAKAEAE